MLFKKNNRSFKFYLLGLSDVEYTEISGLIIVHGGEVCTTRNPPAITFSNSNSYSGGKPIFHINYIRECIFRGELLDLINFNMQGSDPCCISTQIDVDEERWSPVTEEHSYAQGDGSLNEGPGTTTNMAPTVLDSLPQDSQCLSNETVQDSQLLPDESLSPACATNTENAQRLRRPRDNDIKLEIPEPARFEELSFEQNSYNLNQSRNQNTSTPRKSPKIFSEAIPTNVTQLEGIKAEELGIQQTSPSLNINTVCSLSESDEETTVCDDVPNNVEQENEILLNAESQQVQTSELETSNIRTSSPIFGSFKIKPKVQKTHKKACMENQPDTDESRNSISPTILRDETGRVKILGGKTTKSVRKIREFVLESSDSEETVYNPTADFERGRSVDRSSPKLRKVRIKKRTSKKDKAKPGTSRKSDISEDSDETVIINNNERTGQQSEFKKETDEDNYASTTQRITPKVLNEDGNTVVSSTRSCDEVISINEYNSDASVETEAAGFSSRRPTPPLPGSKKMLNEKGNPKNVIPKVRRTELVSRNFLPWEQREMIKYLIDTSSIPDAKGNIVWKQMIADGYLKHRTFQSLNNHFRKYILPNIQRFPMNRENMKKFQKLL